MSLSFAHFKARPRRLAWPPFARYTSFCRFAWPFPLANTRARPLSHQRVFRAWSWTRPPANGRRSPCPRASRRWRQLPRPHPLRPARRLASSPATPATRHLVHTFSSFSFPPSLLPSSPFFSSALLISTTNTPSFLRRQPESYLAARRQHRGQGKQQPQHAHRHHHGLQPTCPRRSHHLPVCVRHVARRPMAVFTSPSHTHFSHHTQYRPNLLRFTHSPTRTVPIPPRRSGRGPCHVQQRRLPPAVSVTLGGPRPHPHPGLPEEILLLTVYVRTVHVISSVGGDGGPHPAGAPHCSPPGHAVPCRIGAYIQAHPPPHDRLTGACGPAWTCGL